MLYQAGAYLLALFQTKSILDLSRTYIDMRFIKNDALIVLSKCFIFVAD